MDEQVEFVEWGDDCPTREERIAEAERCLAKALVAYGLARDAYDFEPWSAAEERLRLALDRVLGWRLPRNDRCSHDGTIVNEISVEGTNDFHVSGRVYCLPCGTEPFEADFCVDHDGQSLASYSLQFGNRSEPSRAKQESRVSKPPKSKRPIEWDFEFHWP
jgi:hypothetical protein